MANPCLLSIIGPTAVGKTRLTLDLAQRYGAEVISCDSRQMYRHMDIGTAKPSPAERAAVRHHFVDHLLPNERMTAGQFEREVDALLKELFEQHALAIMAGGSTLYVRAVWEGMDDMPEVPEAVRAALRSRWQQQGLPPLLEELQHVDPATYARIDRQNPARVLRALEIYHSVGKPISAFQRAAPKHACYRHLKLGLHRERPQLYQRIDQRVDAMLAQGLEQEVQALLDMGYQPEDQGLRAIGYQELVAHFQGHISREEAIRLIKRNSRRYAKRQLTYFRRFPDIHWVDASQPEQARAWVAASLEQAG